MAVLLRFVSPEIADNKGRIKNGGAAMNENMLGIASNTVLTAYPQTITCVLNGTDIIQCDLYGNKKKIGVTQAAYEELEKISNEYYNKLVELKVITPPKTPEELQQEQTQLMADMLKEMQNMKREIEVLKNDQSTSSSTDVKAESTGYEPPCGSMGNSGEHSA